MPEENSWLIWIVDSHTYVTFLIFDESADNAAYAGRELFEYCFERIRGSNEFVTHRICTVHTRLLMMKENFPSTVSKGVVAHLRSWLIYI